VIFTKAVTKTALFLSIACGSFGFAESPPELETTTIDFARLKTESKYFLTETEVRSFLPDEAEPEDSGKKLRGHSQIFLENLYGRLTPGPIPEGAYHGSVLLPTGGDYEVFFQIAKAMGLLLDRPVLEKIMMGIWKGKTFDRTNKSLLNQILDRKLEAFPAKLYCGQSLLDKNEESVIIDYAFGWDLPRYIELRDKIATIQGVNIRDEIRMISPGFYLGRAYMDGIFALNFVLFKSGVSSAAEDCEMKIPANRADLAKKDVK
jgi:hypothetical protein